MSLAAVASSAFFMAASAAWSPIQGRPLTAVALAVHSPALVTAASLPSSVIPTATRPSGVRQRSRSSARPLLIARQLPAAAYIEPAAPAFLGASVRTPSRISRLLFGDGRYRIQPFPTLRTSPADDQGSR